MLTYGGQTPQPPQPTPSPTPRPVGSTSACYSFKIHLRFCLPRVFFVLLFFFCRHRNQLRHQVLCARRCRAVASVQVLAPAARLKQRVAGAALRLTAARAGQTAPTVRAIRRLLCAQDARAPPGRRRRQSLCRRLRRRRRLERSLVASECCCRAQASGATCRSTPPIKSCRSRF